MKILLIFITILFQLWSICHAQNVALYKDGYAVLEIKFEGNIKLNKSVINVQGGNMLSYDRPLNASLINDSTYRISFYTFGPSPVYFTYRDTYFTTVLLPNETDVLKISYKDSVDFNLDYTGYYKDIFFQSKLISEKIADMMFSYGNPQFPEKKLITSAKVVKDSYIRQIHNIQKDMDGSFAKPYIQEYVKRMTFLIKAIDLLKLYDQRVVLHNKNLGLDSLDALNSIPQKGSSFYEDILNELNADAVWPLGYREIVDVILKDPHTTTQSIEEVGLFKFKQSLVKRFNIILEDENSIFYDMALAIAFLNKISNGSPLTGNERADISNYYRNKAIVNYLLHEDEMHSKHDSRMKNGKYFLPFKDKEQDVLKDILTRYRGKTVIIDFWATWCGPCLEAFAQMKPVKQKYTCNNDVVFVYITDESSGQERWNEFINTLDGEHYFLYAKQMKTMMESFNIGFLPSYLFFTKEGVLKHSHVDGYVGNVKFAETMEDLIRME